MTSSAPATEPPATSSSHLVVETAYTTPARPGVLLVGILENGELAPGQELEATLTDGRQTRVVVRAVDSVTTSETGNRTVGLLLEPTDATVLQSGVVLRTPGLERIQSPPSRPKIRVEVSENVRLSLSFSDGATKSLAVVGALLLTFMILATFVLATFYVVTDHRTRTPILATLIISLAAPPFWSIFILIARYYLSSGLE